MEGMESREVLEGWSRYRLGDDWGWVVVVVVEEGD